MEKLNAWGGKVRLLTELLLTALEDNGNHDYLVLAINKPKYFIKILLYFLQLAHVGND